MLTQRKGSSGFVRWALCLIILCGLSRTAGAQRAAPGIVNLADIYFGYAYVRANSAAGGSASNLQGGSASFAYYYHNYLGMVVDVGGYSFSGLPTGLSAHMYTYLFGPRITLRKSYRFSPYAQALIGEGRLNASAGGVRAGKDALVVALGGGIDIGVTHHLAIRAVQAENIMTRFANVAGVSVALNNFRVSAGVVFRF
ncbi:MAG: hypothetical protein WAM91_18070 [Candidatus Acidiferrales bacterium]